MRTRLVAALIVSVLAGCGESATDSASSAVNGATVASAEGFGGDGAMPRHVGQPAPQSNGATQGADTASVTNRTPPPSPPPALAANAVAAEAVALESFTAPARAAAGEPILEELADGKSAVFMTDACPGGNFAEAQLLGTVMCGQEYVVYYDGPTGRWGARGPNRTLQESGVAEINSAALNPGPTPSTQWIVVWGLFFYVEDDGLVKLSDGTPIGHLTPGQ